MGGRASKIQTSILLGAGEGKLDLDEAKRRRMGFWKADTPIDALISNMRYVDDDPVASTAFCIPSGSKEVNEEAMAGMPYRPASRAAPIVPLW